MKAPHPRRPLSSASILSAAWLCGCAGAQAAPSVPGAGAAPLGALAAPAPPAAAPVARSVRVVIERGVEFARFPYRSLRLDVLRPAAPVRPALPAIVFIHGGGWRRGTREDGHALLVPLVETGRYIGVTLDHRYAQEATWPAQIHDAKAAVRWLRTNAAAYAIDPARVAVWGESSGGQIAGVLATTGGLAELEGDIPPPPGAMTPAPPPSSRVQAAVIFCGPTDMEAFFTSATTPDAVAAMHRRLDPLFGGSPSARVELVRSASAIRYVSADDPPLLLIHGTADDLVPFGLSEAMRTKLDRAGVATALVPVEGWGHGFRGPEIDARVQAFFDRYLWGDAVEVPATPVRADRTP